MWTGAKEMHNKVLRAKKYFLNFHLWGELAAHMWGMTPLSDHSTGDMEKGQDIYLIKQTKPCETSVSMIDKQVFEPAILPNGDTKFIIITTGIRGLFQICVKEGGIL